MATIQELNDFKLSDAVVFHDELNPNLWNGTRLDPKVKKQLMLIAEDFITTLGISDLHVKDITVSGSNAAYSYTPHSDLDLHILVDMDKLQNNEVYRELFTAKKTLYNDQHNVSIRNVPVEVYVQDTNEPVNSLGEYSVVNDKWIRIPKKQRANFDQAATKAKYESLSNLIDLALKTADLDRVKKLIDMIRRYRKAGLSKGGEFSPENLAYKAVRSQGAIDALYDLRDTLHGEELSIDEASSREDAIIRINKIKNTAGRTENEIETINGIIEKLMKQYNIRPEELKMSSGISTRNYPNREPVDPLKAKMAKAAYEKQQAASELKREWENFKSRFFKEGADAPAATNVSRIASELKKFARRLGVTAELRQLPEAYFPALELTDLYADKLGTGAGSKVMTELVRLADDAGLNVYLRPSNQGNKAFYAKFGFVKDDKHFAMMVRYPTEEPDEDEVLEEGYTTKQQVIDHFVRMARKRGENVNIARQKGAGAWERGWRGPESNKPKEPKKPKEVKPYDPELYKSVRARLPYRDDDDDTNEDYDPVNETEDRKAAILKIQKHLNKKYGANLDLDGILGPLTRKSINKFMPRAKTGLADEPDKTTAVQGKKVKVSESMNHWQFSKPKKYDREQLQEALEEYFKKDGKWYPHRVHGISSLILQYNTLIESTKETWVDEVKDFWNRLRRLDHRSKLKLNIGTKVSVLQLYTHAYDSDKVFEFRGNLTPKEIVDIDFDSSDRIQTIYFKDGTSFPDRSFIDRGQGGELDGIITMFFGSEKDAEQVLLIAELTKPDGWKISKKNLKEDAANIKEASDYSQYEGEIEDFVQSLSPDEVGVEEFGPYRVHFEGFTDECQEDAERRCNLPSDDPQYLADYDDVYDEVIGDFVKREGGKKPIEVNFAGDDDYPIIYAVFDNPEPYKKPDAWNPKIDEASGYIPSAKEKNDPRFKTALTVDVKPNSIKDNAVKLGLGNIKRTGVPQTANPNGKPRTK